VNRLSENIVLLNLALGPKMGVLLQAVSTFVAGLVVGLYQGWRLALVLLGFVPLLAGVGAATSRWVAASTSRESVAYSAAGSITQEVFSAIRTVAAFTGEPAARRRYAAALESTLRTGIVQKAVSGVGSGTMQLLMFTTYAVVLWFGTYLIRAGVMNGGEVMTVFFSVMMGGSSLGQAAPSMDAIARGRGAAKQIYQLIDRKPEIDARDTSGDKPASCQGELSLRDVHFTYAARPEAPVFRGLSLVAAAGKMTALVGESGSGKSTTIQLFLRMYDVNSGSVTLDGRDLRTLNVAWLRQHVGLVSQEPVLFATSVAENLRYGRPEATQEELEAACTAANAHGFVMTMSQGYETFVGERGTQLSGGQKQRLAIARAVLRNPKVLLLDEATSALDSENERLVQAALDRVRSEDGRTTIAVAHRLTTIRDADCIMVLRQGALLEQGCHDELASRKGGAYAALLALQQQAPDAARAKGGSMPSSLSFVSAEKLAAESQELSAVAVDVDADAKPGKDRPPSPDAETTETPFWRLARLSLPEMHWFTLGAISAAMAGTFFPIFAFILSRILVVFYEPPGAAMAQHALLWCGMFIMLGGACLIITVAQNTCAGLVGQNAVHRVRLLGLAAALRQEVAYFDDLANSSGALTSRLSSDAALLRLIISDGLFASIQNFSTFTCGIVIAFVGGWQLTLVMFGIMPLTAASYSIATKRLTGIAGDTRALFEKAMQIATDAVSNVRTVAAFGAEERVLRLFELQLEGPLVAARTAAWVGGCSQAFSQVMATLPPAFSFWVGGMFIEKGIMRCALLPHVQLHCFAASHNPYPRSFEGVMQVFFALLMSAVGVSQVSALTGDVSIARPAAQALFKLLDRKPAIDSADPGGLQPKDCVGQLELVDVAFTYPTRPGVPVFQRLSLQVPAGRTLALVGESGSGKSTVIQLLLRFYDPDAGSVHLDSTDLRQLNLSWLRRQLGLVSQEPALFATTLAENIGFGAEGSSQEAIEAAAKAANAHGFISELPDGYQTFVGERGVQLSGGQKQRIAIARAVLRNPKVLLLDEATSALDLESERIVQAALEGLQAGRTCVVVAHRLSTIRSAHCIAVMRAGAVMEAGTHEELVARSGAYAKLNAVRGEKT
jgi:ATP-binding cassette subfamily B (MDR/TAP) protein 1